MINKEKENEKLTKIINTLKTNINEFNLLSKTESTKQKNEIEKLKEEIKNLYKKISEKEEQNTTLTNALNQANTAINQSQLEIETRNNTINGLNEEKAQLTKQLNDKQNDFNEYQNSSQQEVEMLKQKLLSAGEEKDNLIKDNEQQINIIKQLKEDINHYETNNNIFLEEKKENDDKFNNLAQAFQIKEGEFSEEIDKLKKLNQKLLSENENLKSKYEKKINLLTLQNNEATLRVKKLINTCISLKEYVLSIERNMNNINNTNNNNSTYVGPNNNTFQGQRFSSVQKNRDILNGMNNIINQIDSKLLNDEFLNQTY
jgi:chromosome segregation ATPase